MTEITYEELNSVWAVKKELEREKRRLLDLQVLAESMTATLDGLPHSKPLTFKVERIAILLTEAKELIDKIAQSLVEAKFSLLTRLQATKINELQQRVLSYHYVACLSLKEIAKLMNFTQDYVWKLHKKGLKSLGLNVNDMKRIKKSNEFVSSSGSVQLESEG